MSAYKGHRGPNVSQYIANLNQLSPEQEALSDPLPLDEDFTAFLNTDFFDVSNGPVPEFNSPIDLAAESPNQPDLGRSSRKRSIQTSAEPTMDFNLNGMSALLYVSSHMRPVPVFETSKPGHNHHILFAAWRPIGRGQGKCTPRLCGMLHPSPPHLSL